MRLALAIFCCVDFTLTAAAQPAASPAQKIQSQSLRQQTPPAPRQVELPVRKVVLYKNGVGYFEHAGTVTGTQQVGIDFTSAQLNDVLQSLTVLDDGGGRISGVNYNSTTPVEQQLRTLALGLNDDPPTVAVYQALRGQRVEVTGTGAAFTGRLVNIESRAVVDKNGQASQDHFYLIITTESGALRTVELTDSISVRMLDPALQKQFASYLEIVASAQNQQVRHLMLEDRGDGARQLRVSYISEVPVWKATYRMVFPRAASGESATAIVQGWAVVDNTVGSDWDNVQLSLVAGAPQSFIQPLSQPLYTRRPEIAIATDVQTTPQTHEAAEMSQALPLNSGPMPAGSPMARKGRSVGALQQNQQNNLVGSASQTVTVDGAEDRALGSGAAGGIGAGMYSIGVDRPSDAIKEGDVSTNAFDDFFQYSLTQPVTIHKNESAMVPILQEPLPAEHVTLWSEKERKPLRAVWLKNTSKLTLDSGSFSIFESGEFAGEGLLDPIHPGERRLLSYATDQAVKVRHNDFSGTRTLHHMSMHAGVIVEITSAVTASTYTVTNGADEPRTVVIEHVRQPGSELISDTKPTETSGAAYRFRIEVAPHESKDLHVSERANLAERVDLNADQFRTEYVINASRYTPELEQKLRPLIDAETALNDITRKLAENEQKEKTLAADEARDRENVTALKGNDAARRFVDELNRAEDDLQATRKEHAALEQQRDTARAQLEAEITKASFETDLSIVTQGPGAQK